jgi:hypothetical protein
MAALTCLFAYVFDQLFGSSAAKTPSKYAFYDADKATSATTTTTTTTTTTS